MGGIGVIIALYLRPRSDIQARTFVELCSWRRRERRRDLLSENRAPIATRGNVGKASEGGNRKEEEKSFWVPSRSLSLHLPLLQDAVDFRKRERKKEAFFLLRSAFIVLSWSVDLLLFFLFGDGRNYNKSCETRPTPASERTGRGDFISPLLSSPHS